MSAVEVNFDGLIGPNHNYSGLSEGNLASAHNQGQVSYPKQAALQGLEKMRKLVKAGFVQGVFPPPARPNSVLLQAVSSPKTMADQIDSVARFAPNVLRAAYSASSMWAANAATVSPSLDTAAGRLTLTPANLVTMLHRSVEATETFAMLRFIFSDPDHFQINPPLPAHSDFADEGAANHTRLCASHGVPGVSFFVYGRKTESAGTRLPARQSQLASQSIAHQHGLAPERTVFARQSATAIDAGAFHNDVVCVGTLDTLFFHELAFADTDAVLQAIKKAATGLFELKPIMVPDAEVPIEDAIKSYLFNSQLLHWPGEDRLVLLAPSETQDMPSTEAYCKRLVESNGPIGRVDYVDVRQSMRNGGGPACLRLRIVMTEAQIAAAHSGVFLTEAKIDALQSAVSQYYCDTLSPQDLTDPGFADDCRRARHALLKILNMEALADL